MNPESQESYWLGKLANLNVARTRERGIAPHKLLLILSLIDLIEAGEIADRWVCYNDHHGCHRPPRASRHHPGVRRQQLPNEKELVPGGSQTKKIKPTEGIPPSLFFAPVTLRSAPPPSGVPYAKISDSFPPKTAPVGNCRRGSVLIVAANHL